MYTHKSSLWPPEALIYDAWDMHHICVHSCRLISYYFSIVMIGSVVLCSLLGDGYGGIESKWRQNGAFL